MRTSLCFPSTHPSSRLCCGSFSRVFRRRDEFANSGRVSRSLCAFAKNKRNLHPDGQTLTQLATSVHSVWWNACLLMQIFIQDLSNLLICICVF